MKHPIAVIFDMDGVIIDNNPYHKEAWNVFCKKYALEINAGDLIQNVWGRTNEDILNFVFQRNLSLEESLKYADEKEFLYRELYKEFVTPVKGLIHFLEDLKINKVRLGVATSALSNNLNFILEHIPIRNYFSAMVDGSQIANGKPDPEVYLKAAERLGVLPENCVAVEDSFSGIQSALNAGMKVIGVTTTHSKEELVKTHLAVNDFTAISYNDIVKLF
jgi:beta-phosphoglucomutase family hydrolase